MRNRIIFLCICVLFGISLCSFSLSTEELLVDYISQYSPKVRTDDFEYIVNDDGTVTIVCTPLQLNIGVTEVPEYLDGKKVTVIGKLAYAQTHASKIILHEGIKTIDKLAIADTRYLSCVVLPDSIETIGDYAFYMSTSLEEISIPDTVKEIGQNPFAYGSKLRDIRISDSHPALFLQDGVLFDKSMERLICYPLTCQNTEYSIPNGIKTIDNYAFAGQEYICRLSMPDSVIEIGENAFRSCSTLEEIEMPAGLKVIKENAFMECLLKYKLILPDGLETIGPCAFFGCYGLQYIKVPASVTDIGEAAFARCSKNLTLIVEEDSAAEKYAIENDIPYSYTDIDDFEFIEIEPQYG